VLPQAEAAVLQAQIARVLAEREPEEGQDVCLADRIIGELRTISPEAGALARTAEYNAGIPLERISARYWQTERAFHGVDALPVGGYRVIIDKALEKSGAEIKLNTEVESIERTTPGVKLRTVAGETYEASHVWVALTVPSSLAHQLRPPLMSSGS
jgi:phytoene dehydrogenase-like protein